MPVTDKRIGVIAGGRSAEREVSLKSGTAVYEALKRAGYNVVFIDADQDLPFVLKKERVELAFLVLHGGWGENGAVQGLLEVMGIAYTGSGVLGSAAGMDKIVSKKLFQAEGLKVPDYMVVDAEEPVTPQFSLPWVVKPRQEGSSVGVTIVDEVGQYEKAVAEASRFGRWVVVERYIKGKEVQIGVLGDRALGGVEVRPKRRFYDYVAKYTPGQTEYILPPEIDERTYKKAMEIGLKAHRALNCSGATRVDLIVTEDEIYVLEVNTIPGMTETSLLPKIAKLAGYSFLELLEEIIKEALREHGKKAEGK